MRLAQLKLPIDQEREMNTIAPLDPRRPAERTKRRKVVSLGSFSSLSGANAEGRRGKGRAHPSLVENVPSDQSQTDLVDGSGSLSNRDPILLVLPDNDLSLSRRQHLSRRQESIRGRGVGRGRIDSNGLDGGGGGESGSSSELRVVFVRELAGESSAATRSRREVLKSQWGRGEGILEQWNLLEGREMEEGERRGTRWEASCVERKKMGRLTRTIQSSRTPCIDSLLQICSQRTLFLSLSLLLLVLLDLQNRSRLEKRWT